MVDHMNIGVDMEATVGRVFVSTYVHSLDPKRRLTIPSGWREIAGLPRQLFVLPGVDTKCLCVYPAREMNRKIEKLRNISIADAKGRKMARVLASRSDLVPWDSQGRIRIKEELLQYAELQNEVVLAGTFDGFELWNPDRWREEYESAEQPGLADAAREVGF